MDARVIVIGGGIVGVSILYHLAKAGCKDALLLERNELTSGATWHAAGNVHTQSAYPALSALQAYSLRLYDGLAEEVGQEVGSHVVGGFFLAQSKERMEEFKFLAGKFKALGIEYDLVTPSEINDRHPLIDTTGLYGAAWDPEEGYVDPYSVTMGLAAGARQNGAKILRGKRVDAIERLPGGWRIRSGAESWTCETVVNAGGFWAHDVAELVGARLPITNMEHQYLVTETMPEVDALDFELPMIRDTDSQYYLRQEAKGLLIGPWEKDCRAAWQANTPPWNFGMELFDDDLDRIEEGLMAAYTRIPALNTAGIKRVVNGAISFAPDARPILGPLPGVPDFFVACGFLGGIAQGGGIGKAMSEWILNGKPEEDLSFLDVARFGDWTTKDFAYARTHEVLPRRYEIIYPHLERKTGRDLRKTPIHDRLLSQGAVMGQVFGWERPLWYAPSPEEAHDIPSFSRPNWFEPVGEECKAVAERAGLIEMTSFSKFEISGPDAAAFLNHLCASPLPKEPGQMRLALMLTEAGGIVGDLTLCCLAEDQFYAVGASLAETLYRRWFESHTADYDVSVRVVTGDWGALGLTGPASRTILSAITKDSLDNASFPFMSFREITAANVRVRALRVSYAGELGWELHCPIADLPLLFDALIEAGGPEGLALVGSRAMGNLRLEKGYRSWGAELTTDMTPAMVGLAWLCSKKKDYIGRAAIEVERRASSAKCLATLTIEAEGADCWGSEPIFRDGALVGYATSGGYGWRTGESLCVGYMDRAAADPGTSLEVQILGTLRKARVVADPLFDPGNSRLTEK